MSQQLIDSIRKVKINNNIDKRDAVEKIRKEKTQDKKRGTGKT